MAESPTQQLRDEHELVLMVVRAMEREAASIERTGRVHADRVAKMVDFTRNFTDGDHHTKEEDLLFPLLGDEFARVEAEKLNAGETGRYHRLAHTLATPPAEV